MVAVDRSLKGLQIKKRNKARGEKKRKKEIWNTKNNLDSRYRISAASLR